MVSAPFWLLILIGCSAGSVSGLIGIGGGVIIVPALMFLAGYPQLTAVGTSLAILLPPVGFAAAIQYYRGGHVDVRAAIVIATTFFLCAWGSAFFAKKIDPVILRVGFGVLTIAIGVYIIISAGRMIR
ncbi:MAG: sulfite exporter TauE/SafE family protein [Chitinispirillaceae bacterium]|nr:sulfite exporter TauE/SafE family protein [Chitinispirillaceae bacterium]